MQPFMDSARLARLAALSRSELEALQLRRLRHQLARLHGSSEYYRRRMDAAGIAPDAIASLDEFRTRFPLSNKADFLADQAEHQPFGQRLGIAREDVALVNMTGGTSGQGRRSTAAASATFTCKAVSRAALVSCRPAAG